MSGIVGIFQRNGAPVAVPQLRLLVDALQPLAGASPDIWVGGPVGLARVPWHSAKAIVETRHLAESHLHITADVHLVERAKLRTELASAGAEILAQASDAQLLIHAYTQWGPHCVERLRGDFSFAIWDARAQTLFCARDHFGIKPFYYALFDALFVFSNSLDTLHQHPQISAALNESAVADFFLFGLNCDNATSTFRDIQRLPPAHSLVISREAIHLRRYWEVPADGRLRYARANDYIENFLAVWTPAVAERLDETRTGILLSGGLDSAAVAATAKAQSPSALKNLCAFTIAYQNLPADRDPQLAATLAQSLAIPWRSIAVDHLRPFADWGAPQPISPEPVDDPLFAALPFSYKTIATVCQVLLSGEGADNLMHFAMLPYAQDLFARREWPRLLSELSEFAWRRPFPWRGLHVRLQALLGRGESAAQPFPKWIAPDFAKRLDLPERWATGQPLPRPPHRHPIYPMAHASMYLPQWTRLFEMESPGVTKSPVVVRYPFLDLRVVEYLLAIPPFPWAFEKTLLRQAMAGRVLDTVRLRPKTPFAGDPLLLQLQRSGPFRVESSTVETSEAETAAPSSERFQFGKGESGGFPWIAEADLYINRSSLLSLHGKMTSAQVNQMARPICFNFWLQSVRKVGYN